VNGGRETGARRAELQGCRRTPLTASVKDTRFIAPGSTRQLSSSSNSVSIRCHTSEPPQVRTRPVAQVDCHRTTAVVADQQTPETTSDTTTGAAETTTPGTHPQPHLPRHSVEYSTIYALTWENTGRQSAYTVLRSRRSDHKTLPTPRDVREGLFADVLKRSYLADCTFDPRNRTLEASDR
jgi:hypothetical protein